MPIPALFRRRTPRPAPPPGKKPAAAPPAAGAEGAAPGASGPVPRGEKPNPLLNWATKK